jgi:hypothetical protein
MVAPHGVPEHDVGLFDRAVGGGPLGQPGSARMLVGKIARREALAVGVQRDPQVRS